MRAVIATLTISSLLVASCGKKDDKSNSSPSNMFTVNGLTAKQGWCHIENMTESFHIVSRVNIISEDKLRMDRIAVSGNDIPVVHRFSKEYGYNDWGGLSSFKLKSVEGAEVAKLKGFRSQQIDAQELLKKNKKLQSPANPFDPERAIVLEASGLFSSSEMQLYPCADMTPTLDETIQERPIVELQVRLGNLMGSIRYDRLLPLAMLLDLPVNEIPADRDLMEGTQWCNWFEMGSKSNPIVKILTLGKNSFRHNEYTGQFDIYEQHPTILQENVQRAKIYDYVKETNAISGTRMDTIGSSTYPDTSSYKMLKDAKGVKVLFRDRGEHGALTFMDFYYSCNDKRPLDAYKDYKKGLPKLLELERE